MPAARCIKACSDGLGHGPVTPYLHEVVDVLPGLGVDVVGPPPRLPGPRHVDGRAGLVVGAAAAAGTGAVAFC